MRHAPLLSASLLTLVSGAALADPATPEIAKSIQQGYVAYLTQAVVDSGVLSVVPDGESYLVTWNLQKAVDLTNPPKGAVKVENLTYRLTPGPNGVWTLKGDKFPKFALKGDKKTLASGGMSATGFHIDGVYDPRGPEFVTAKIGADKIDGAFEIEQGGTPSAMTIVQDGLTVDLHAKQGAAGAGIDVVANQTVRGLVETIGAAAAAADGAKGGEVMKGGAVKRGGGTMKGTDDDEEDAKDDSNKDDSAPASAANMTYKMSGLTGQSLIAGLRVQEMSDLWKYVVQHINDAAAPAELKPRLKAALPLWKDLTARAEVGDMNIETPMGSGTAKSFGETIHVSGLSDKGVAQFAIKLDNLAIQSPMAPPWTASFTPVSIDVDVSASSDGWDKIANIVLDDPKFGDKGDMSPETNAAVLKTVMGGNPKVTLAPGHLKTPSIDMTFEGAVTMPGGAPKGNFHITADSLDKTLAVLSDIAKDQPDAQGAMLGVTFVKGLAKTGDGGRLVWDVEVGANGAVKINGQAMPTGK